MAQARNPFFSGVAFAIAAPLLYSATVPLSKIFSQQVEPWMLAGLLDLCAGIGVAVVYLLQRFVIYKAPHNALRGRDWRWLLLSILIGGLFAPVLQTYGIAYSSASVASLMLNLEGVFTALIAWWVFREPFDRRVAWGLGMITLGSMVLVWQGDAAFSLSWGAIAIAGASLAWATSSNLTQKIADRNPLQVVMYRVGVSGSLNTTLAFLAGNALPAPPLLGAIALTGLFCIALTFLCFMLALRQIGTSRAGTFFSLFPFTGAVLSIISLNEPVTSRLLIAGVLMAIGLGFCLKLKET
ncbi:DMT family transporter [Oscillatoria sp. FACHB-1407]|uniref:DMT family transporter n=1 Tax=Oscillatoria sp. FACHB-1407 TaxID=2692847 RepID=UPI001683392E|nr:DMT family transporter [Oscillatoria sp. FACHB-1407]MBD2464796.1 DMT family transporter [Oscillatoria sp. FACHB-1407]